MPYTVPPDVQESIRALDGRMKRIEQKFRIEQTLVSVKDLEKHIQNAFEIKGSVYEVHNYLHINFMLIIEIINFAILPQRHS